MKPLTRFAVTLGALAFTALVAQASPTAGHPNKDTIEASIYRGKIAFEHYCAKCHGVRGDGNGRAAKLYNPRPANLITSDKNAQYKELIIRQGGEALGRSPFMPPWANELTDEQIRDVVNYLATFQSGAKIK